jgi:hypothetical protein
VQRAIRTRTKSAVRTIKRVVGMNASCGKTGSGS